MKRSISLALAILIIVPLAAVSSAQAWSFGRGVKGSGDLETRSLDLDAFDSIRIDGGFDLEIGFGDRQEVEVTIDDNLWDLLEAEVDGRTLELDWAKSVRPDRDCKIRLVVRSLKEIQVNGACDVEIDGFHGEEFRFECHGAGDLTIDGDVEDLTVVVSGAGDVDAGDLVAEHVDVRISGAGNALVHATRSLKGRISGVGNLEYRGDPVDKDTHVSGIGHVSHR